MKRRRWFDGWPRRRRVVLIKGFLPYSLITPDPPPYHSGRMVLGGAGTLDFSAIAVRMNVTSSLPGTMK